MDRPSRDKLLASLIEELKRLHKTNQAILAKIAALETFQSVSDRALEPASTAPAKLAGSVTVDAASSLSAENGFYGLEYDANGIPYRWTGPESAFHFDLLVDRSTAAALTLRFLKVFMHPSPQNKLGCFVDGQEAAVRIREVDGEFELDTELPRRNASGSSLVMFGCPTLKPSLTAGASPDQRDLGLAFRWLKVERAAGAFDAAFNGSYPVPGLTLDGTHALWGVLTVPRGGSLSVRAPGVLFKVEDAQACLCIRG